MLGEHPHQHRRAGPAEPRHRQRLQRRPERRTQQRVGAAQPREFHRRTVREIRPDRQLERLRQSDGVHRHLKARAQRLVGELHVTASRPAGPAAPACPSASACRGVSECVPATRGMPSDDPTGDLQDVPHGCRNRPTRGRSITHPLCRSAAAGRYSIDVS